MDTARCRDCHQVIVVKYPDAPEHVKWGHTSIDDARDCPGKGWPMPETAAV